MKYYSAKETAWEDSSAGIIPSHLESV
jgi:hypothetical protein